MRSRFQNQQNDEPVLYAAKKIEACLKRAFEVSELAEDERLRHYESEVWITFVTADEIRAINRSERSIDRVTDVLSFPLLELRDGRLEYELEAYDFHPDSESEEVSAESSEDDFEEEGTMLLDLGDILICSEKAADQAHEAGHSLLREYCFLAVHGMLHLLGFDHERGEADEEKMFALQDEILDELGITRDPKAYPAIPDSEAVYDPELWEMTEPEEAETDEAAAEGSTDEALPAEEGGLTYRFGEDIPAGEALLPEGFRSGFVAIMGRPNAGKSTLLNRLSGDELAIVSPKAQTTRHNIKTVLDDGEAQIIFVDTPGIHRSKNKLDRYMTDSAWYALQDADLGLLLVDPAKGFISEVEKVCCKKADELGIPLILLLTKTDAQSKESLLPVISRYAAFYPFKEIIPISAEKNDQIDLLLEKIKENLPEGPRYYSPDAYTDQTERALAAEYIREQLLHYTHQEVPHQAAVLIEAFKEFFDEEGERSLVRIAASIIVDKDSHKGIIIGKGGQSLKRIGQAARIKLENLLGCKVYLEIHVKVRPGWQSKDSVLKSLGYVKGKSGQSADDIL